MLNRFLDSSEFTLTGTRSGFPVKAELARRVRWAQPQVSVSNPMPTCHDRMLRIRCGADPLVRGRPPGRPLRDRMRLI